MLMPSFRMAPIYWNAMRHFCVCSLLYNLPVNPSSVKKNKNPPGIDPEREEAKGQDE